MVAAFNGAEKVVITDYPEQQLIHMMENNVRNNIPEEKRANVFVKVTIFFFPFLPLPLESGFSSFGFLLFFFLSGLPMGLQGGSFA